MALSRHGIIDSYTLEELRREYQNTDAKGRISLLKKLYGEGQIPPYEIARLAVEDQDVQVRQWIAKNGEWLDYRDSQYVDKQLVYKYPDRNLKDRLKNDPDPFVRACLRENPAAFRSWDAAEWYAHFWEATHLERLALVRNPEVHEDLIECIFDHEATELGIDLQQREQLVLAFLSNEEAIRNSYRQEYKGLGTERFSKLWRLASKWPESVSVQYAVYRYLGAKDETKAEIYQACDKPLLRQTILENCNGNNTKTIMLGRKDSDEQCRETALQAVKNGGGVTHRSLKTFLENKDTHVLCELASNESLTVFELLEIRDRLHKLRDKNGAEIAERTVVRKQNAPLTDWQLRGFRISSATWDNYKAVLIAVACIGGVYWLGDFQTAVLIALVIVAARALMRH